MEIVSKFQLQSSLRGEWGNHGATPYKDRRIVQRDILVNRPFNQWNHRHPNLPNPNITTDHFDYRQNGQLASASEGRGSRTGLVGRSASPRYHGIRE
jgi:hypothetical protein